MFVEIFTIILVLLVTLYVFLTWNYNYWRKKGIPQMEPVIPGAGNLLDALLLRKATSVIHIEIYKKFSGHAVCGFYKFRQPSLLVRDPETIQKILVTNFSGFHDNDFPLDEKLDSLTLTSPFFAAGTKWKENRSAIAPGFTSIRIKSLFPKMQEICDQLIEYLDKHVGESIEAKELAYLYTTDVVSNCGFGVASNAFEGSETMFQKYGKIMMAEGFGNEFVMMTILLLPSLARILRLRLLSLKVRHFIEEMVYSIKEYREKNKVTQNDYIQMLLKNREKSLLEGETNGKSVDESKIKLLGHAMTFFTEGFETSSMTGSFTLYELAKNIDVQEKLRQELQDAMITVGNPLDYDTFMNLPYLDKVMLESMRKYPVVYSIVRVCTQPTTLEIDGKPLQIEAGTPVVIPVYGLHHDPQHFPNPEKFDPERFSKENISQRHRYCYLPFGEGPRICIGMRFALAQVKALVASIVLNYNIVRCDKTADELTFSPELFLLSSKEGVWIQLEKRH